MPADNFQSCGGQIFLKWTFIVIILVVIIIIIIIAVDTDNNDEISKNSWGCAKKVFKSGTSVSIFQHRHTTYFKDVLKRINRMTVFTIPFWMSKLKEPNIPFNLSPPS